VIIQASFEKDFSLPVRKIETMRTVAAAPVDIIDALSLESE